MGRTFRATFLQRLLGCRNSITIDNDAVSIVVNGTSSSVCYDLLKDDVLIQKDFLWANVYLQLVDETQLFQFEGFSKHNAVQLKKMFNVRKAHIHQKRIEHETFQRELKQQVLNWLALSKEIIDSASTLCTKLRSGTMYIRKSSCDTLLQFINNVENNKPKDIEKLDSVIPELEIYKELKYKAEQLHNRRADRNNSFVVVEPQRYKDFFDNIEANPLTPKQCEACVTNEDSNLVIAGAGSGKTSVMIARAAYLVEAGLAKPEEILMICYNKDAATELVGRAKKRLPDFDIKAQTFHSLGRAIVGQVEKKIPSLSPMAEDQSSLHKFIDTCIIELLISKVNKAFTLTFMNRYLKPAKNKNDFKSKREYDKHIKKNEIRTLDGRGVRSIEECTICNFLFLHGVKYEYEPRYPHAVNMDGDVDKGYHPDFLLTDYGIYLEHFGVDRSMQTPPFMDNKKYVDGIHWKRGVHLQYNTTLLETYSYQAAEGTLEDDLKELLTKHGVEMHDNVTGDIFSEVREKGAVRVLSEIVGTFLTTHKESQKPLSEVLPTGDSALEKARNSLFRKIYSHVEQAYKSKLDQDQHIDFNDMINRATDHVRRKGFSSPYKYIMVDEFQDLSHGKALLIKALQQQNPSNSLFCVGDDWQAIYSFAGSDITIIQNFEKHFGVVATTKLDMTFRFNNQISKLASDFVMRNPIQIKKKISTMKSEDHPMVTVVKHIDFDEYTQLDNVLNSIVEQGSNKLEVMVLYRAQHLLPKGWSKLQYKYAKGLKKLTAQSVHSSKGREADYVILVGCKQGFVGFPSEKEVDPLLSNLLSTEETDLEYPEERRLFYVAVTRAKKKVYILANMTQPSAFIQELSDGDYNIATTVLCDKHAATGHIVECQECDEGHFHAKNGPHGPFYSCNVCKTTISVCKKCESAPMVRLPHAYVCHSDECDHEEERCPACETGKLVERKSRNGRFYGCSNFPRGECSYTRNIA